MPHIFLVIFPVQNSSFRFPSDTTRLFAAPVGAASLQAPRQNMFSFFFSRLKLQYVATNIIYTGIQLHINHYPMLHTGNFKRISLITNCFGSHEWHNNATVHGRG